MQIGEDPPILPALVRPIDIVHERTANRLTVTWEHGVESLLSASHLRGWCPCAACQGHGAIVRYREPGAAMTLVGLYEMGSYALGIRFSDGHDSGIYTWQWLWQISAESEPPGIKRGRFIVDRYEPEDVRT